MPEKPRADVGARLRAAREARGLSLRQIASSTKISLPALEALERNEVKRLPGGIFTRAFVRAYAIEVGLDPEQTIRDFLVQFPIEGVADGSPYANDSQERDQFQSQQRIASAVVRILLLSVPLAGVVIFFTLRGDSGAPGQIEGGPGETAPAVAETPAPDAAVPAAEWPSPAPGGEVAPAAAESLVIAIHPHGPCWVSLVIDDEQVFSRVMQGGERIVREARREIVLSIGDAGAFDFTLNDRPGRALGASGEVVRAQITHENLVSYLMP